MSLYVTLFIIGVDVALLATMFLNVMLKEPKWTMTYLAIAAVVLSILNWVV